MADKDNTLPIAAGLNLLGGVAGIAGQAIQNRENRKLAEYSYKKDLEQWNRTNLYNSPTSQMQRLRSAGLNPNLVYGNGSIGNTSGGSPTYQTPDYKLDTARIMPDPMEKLGQYQTLKLGQAQTNNVLAEMANKNQDTANKQIINSILETEAKAKGIDLNIKDATQENKIAESGIKLEKTKQELRALGISTDLAEILSPYQSEAAALGIQKTKAETANIVAQKLKTKAETKSISTANEYQVENIKAQLHQLRNQSFATAQEGFFKMYENQLRKQGITSSDNVVVRQIVKMIQSENDTTTIQGKVKYLLDQIGIDAFRLNK